MAKSFELVLSNRVLAHVVDQLDLDFSDDAPLQVVRFISTPSERHLEVDLVEWNAETSEWQLVRDETGDDEKRAEDKAVETFRTGGQYL